MLRTRTLAIARPAAVPAAPVLLALALLLAAAPAHADSKRGSFDRAPFYHGKPAAGVSRVAHVAPVFVSTGTLQADPAKSAALREVLDGLAAELDSLGLTTAVALPEQGAPRVTFGCYSGEPGPDGAIVPEDECDPTTRRMRFAVTDPSKAWRESLRAATGDSLQGVLVFDLSFGQYWLRQKDWKGNKQIELGTGHRMPVPWLTSLDDPVEVLQLSAALVTADGKVVRVGSEGLIARRTGMTASVFGAQEILTEDDLATLRTLRREDLPGTPRVWQAAVRTLVERLLSPAS